MVGRLHRFHPSLPVLSLVFLGFCAQSLAQDQADAPTLAGSVPTSTRILVNIHRLDDADRALRKANAWPFIAFLGFKPAERSDINFKAALSSILKLPESIPESDLKRCEIGLAADSWSRLADPTVLIRASDAALLARWFPSVSARGADSQSARVFRADDERFVCIRDNIVALAPRGNDWAQLGAVLRAMAGGEADVLGKTAAYRELVAYLPGDPIATIYYAAPGPQLASANDNGPTKLALGVYSKDETVDIAVRGVRQSAAPRIPISTVGVERLLKLPQTTLGAYLTSVDWSALLAQSGSHPGTLQRYLRLLLELARGGSTADPPPRLGNQLILAWAQDFSSDGSLPQLAALVETPDGLLLSQYANRTASSLSRILSSLELRDVSSEIKVRSSTHLGVAVSSVSLREFASKSRFAWVKALAGLEPSWAASGNWFIIALTPDHMHRILDAQIGFMGSLADQRKYHPLRERPQQNTAVALFQGTLAAATMRQWERKLRSADLAAVFAKIWKPPTLDDPDRLGVDVSDAEHFGMVEVAAVVASSPSEGRLRPGDRIFGVDGRLLDLVAPVDDLSRWWEEAAPGSIHTLRVLRGSEVVELEVTRRFDEMSIEDLFAKPIELLRELALLSEAIPLATFQIHNTDDRHISALLRLRIDSRD